MSLNSLDDVYVHQLQDLYSACRQAQYATTQLGRAAKDEELSKALIAGSEGISRGIDLLASICATHKVDPEAEHCKAMEGLVSEARRHALDTDFGSDDARDAMIISQYQRMVHYAIAGYGTLVAFANELGLDREAAQLQSELDENYGGDRHMSKIAKSRVNLRAA